MSSPKLARLVLVIAGALAAVLLVASPVLAYTYRAQIAIVETGGINYPDLPVMWNVNTDYLSSNGFLLPSGLDARVQTLGGLNKPVLVTDSRVLTSTAVPANSQVNLYMLTGQTAAAYMPVITGDGGYVTRVNHASMEPGNDYAITVAGSWVTSTSILSKYAVYRLNNLWLWSPPGSGLIAGVIPSYTFHELNAAGAGTHNPYGVNWYAQTLTVAADRRLARVRLTLTKAGAPTGNIIMQIRSTAAGVPAGPAGVLATTSFPVSAVAAGPANVEFDIYSFLSNGGQYAIVLAVPNGDAANYVAWPDGAALGGESLYASTNSGSTWTAVAADMTFITWTASMAVWGTVADGTHTVILDDNGANTTLSIDGSVPATTGTDAAVGVGAAVNWEFFRGGGNPSAYLIMANASSGARQEELRYQPITRIVGTTLPDRTGAVASDGTIVWGANPAGVTVTMGGLLSTDPPVAIGPGVGGTRESLPPVGSNWGTDPDVTGALMTNPMRPIVVAISDNTSFTERQVWVWGGLAVLIFITALVARVVRGHHLITGIAVCGAIVGLVVMTIWPPWSLVFAAIALFGGVVSERTHSL